MTTEEAIKWMQETKIGGKVMGDKDVVDAVEVVRCGRCAKSTYSKIVSCAYKCENRRSPCFGRTTYADFGCVYGERKDNE